MKLTKLEAKKQVEKFNENSKSKDAKRLIMIVDLMNDDGIANLQDVYDKVYSDSKNPANAINVSKKNIATAAKQVRMVIDVCTDNLKHAKTSDRELWIESESIIKPNILPKSDILNKVSSSKKTLKYFVSYAHANKRLVKSFLEMFGNHIGNRKDTIYKRWIDEDLIIGEDWEEGIQSKLDECDFGLLLLTPAFFNRQYIIKSELTKFIEFNKATDTLKIIKPIFPIGLEEFDLGGDLFGLQKSQIYRLNDKFYDKPTNRPHKNKFALEAAKKLDIKFAKLEPKENHSNDDEKNTPIDIIKDETEIECISAHQKDIYKIDKIGNRLKPNKISEAHDKENEDSDKGIVAVKFLDDWLYKSNKTLFALLGQFGMGKTFTLQTYSNQVLEKYSKNHDDYTPIYLDLRKLDVSLLEGNEFNIWNIIDFILKRSESADEVNPLTAEIVKNIWKNRKTLIIFDGIDEVLPHINQNKTATYFLQEIFKLIPYQPTLEKNNGKPVETEKNQRVKMIISCRTDYFKAVTEQMSFFQNLNREHRKADDDFETAYLLPFNDEQILKFLKHSFPNRDAAQMLKTIKDIHNLSEMASRPVFLDFITDIFDKIENLSVQGKSINSSTLYDLIIEKNFARDEGKHEINTTVKLQLLEEIAAFLWKRSSKRISFAKLETFLAETLSTGNALMKTEWKDNSKRKENLFKDLRNASLLTRSKESDFGFAHTSIQEYFLAKYIIRNIQAQNWQNLQLKNVSPETIDFIHDILAIMDKDDLQEFNQNWMLAFKKPQTEKTKLLFNLYYKDYNQKRLLSKPNPLDLTGINLHNSIIHGKKENTLDLSQANLKNANLAYSELRYINFDNANLSNANLTDCEILDCSMNNTKLKKVILSGILRNVQAENINVKGSNLLYTQILKSNWQPKNQAKSQAEVIETQIIDTKQQQLNALLAEIDGHHSTINHTAISPDGTKALSASDDGTMKYWDLSQRKLLHSFAGHKEAVTSCVFSPDGSKALSASDDGTMKYWDLNDKKLLHSFAGHESIVTSCAFSPDGSKALSASWDETMIYWNLSEKKLLHSFAGHKDSVTSCAFSPDGSKALSASNDSTMKYWDLSQRKLLHSFAGHKEAVTSCAFSPEGGKALSASRDGAMKYWDLNDKKLLHSFAGHKSIVTSCAFSPDGSKALSASDDATMRYWDLSEKKLLHSFSRHENVVTSCAFSPDGSKALSASWDDTMKYWDLNEKKLLHSFAGHKEAVTSCAFSPDGTKALSASGDNTMKYWDLSQRKLLHSFAGHKSIVTSCAFSPDGSKALSASDDSTMKYWDLSLRKLLYSFDEHKYSVASCAFSPDGTKALSASDDRTMKYWDLTGQKLLYNFVGHFSLIMSCAFSPDGTKALSTSWDSTMKYWDLSKKKLLRSFDGHKDSVTSCAFSPDGSKALSASDDSTMKYWDLSEQKLLYTISLNKNGVNFCAFSPDGSKALFASGDNTMKYWDLSGLKLLYSFDDHKGKVSSCAFSPDGSKALSVSDDGSMKYWNLTTKQVLTDYIHFRNNATAIKEDGKIIQTYGEVWRHLQWQKTEENGEVTLHPYDAYEFVAAE